MNHSGDAAEQVVRLSLEGTEVALRLSGAAAKNIAVALYTIIKNKDHNKTAGYQKLSSMLKSGKELKVFTISEQHLAKFAEEAKRYGVVYCALKGKEKSEDGMVDVMVRAEDASKINRIVERFQLATVDAASIRHDIVQSKEEPQNEPAVEQEVSAPEKDREDKLVDELLGVSQDKGERPNQNPTKARTEKESLSEHSYGKRRLGAPMTERKSVREELRQIKQERKQKEPQRLPELDVPKKEAPQPMNVHIPPGKKDKTKVR